MLNDDYIKQIFKPANHKYIIKSNARNQIINNNKDIKTYLDNRYPNVSNYDEILYLIFNNLIEPKKCVICGKPLKFYNITYGYKYQVCSKQCKAELFKQTCIQKYGVDNPAKSKEIYDKIKQTNLLKYGVDNPAKSAVVKEKTMATVKNMSPERKHKIYNRIKQTCIQKYGVSNNLHIPEVQNKIKQNYIKKYGVQYGLAAKQVREKIKQTSMERYGVENPIQAQKYRDLISKKMSTPEMQTRINNAKKKNHTFNTSKIEQQFKKYLEQNYPNDFECQYRSEMYPFNCDFYIKSLDLYIEIQGSWVHGKHPFDENNQEDIDRLNCMKSKNTRYYQNSIYVWTISDIAKRNTAKQNNLNYLEIFSTELNECINALYNYLKEKEEN